jgi:hypothetical protein
MLLGFCIPRLKESGSVIPVELALDSDRGRGIQFRNTGFRIRSGMTNKVNGFLIHHTRVRKPVSQATV